MLQDIENTPTHQRLTQKGKREGLQQAILDLIQARFPSLQKLAEKQLEPITNQELLRQAIIQVGLARTARELHYYLQELKEPQP